MMPEGSRKDGKYNSGSTPRPDGTRNARAGGSSFTPFTLIRLSQNDKKKYANGQRQQSGDPITPLE
jgi:hypothetical protein